jgi:hypothetical protein
MKRGKTLTLLGAIRQRGWVTLQAMFATTNADRFVAWLTRQLLPRLRPSDVLIMDNLAAHRNARVRPPAAPVAYACCTCRRTRQTSIRLNWRVGLCR